MQSGPFISMSAHRRDRGSVFNAVVDRFERNLPLLALIIVALLTIYPGMSRLPLLDRDEPRFSRATVEMVERDDWVVPYFNDEYRFDKPPLTYWWMAWNYQIFGQTELGARFHSLVSTILVAWLIWAFVSRFLDPGNAVAAAVAWITCAQVFQHGRLALADMPLIASITATHLAMYRLWLDPEPTRIPWFWWTTLYLSLAIGFFAKGPLAFLCPLMTILAFRWIFWRRGTKLTSWRPLPGLLISVGLIALWGIPALRQTQGLFWDVGIGTHVVDRGTSAFNDRSFTPWFYFISIFVSLFPWLPRLTSGWVDCARTWSIERAFLWSWAMGPYLIFMFYATQLPHYTLPAFPALLLLGYSNDGGTEKTWLGNATKALYLLVIFFVLAFGVLAMFISSPGPEREFGWAVLWFGVTLFAFGMFAHFRNRRQYLASYFALALIGTGAFFFAAQARALGATREVGAFLESNARDGRGLGVRILEPSLVFYGNRFWDFSRYDTDWLEIIDEKKPSAILLLKREHNLIPALVPGLFTKVGQEVPKPKRDFSEEVDGFQPPDGYLSTPIQGINFARPSWVELELWYLPKYGN